MKITIDTQVDSHEDIQRVLAALSNLTGKSAPSNYDQRGEQVDTTNMMSMFATPETTSTQPASQEPVPTPQQTEGTAPDFTSFLNIAQKAQEEKKNDEPKIEFL